MPKMIKITVGDVTAIASLKDSPTAKAIQKALPIEGKTQRWGGEIYFPVDVNTDLEPNSRQVLLPGELGFWPDGKMFCIFFGPTPRSKGEEIRPASAVNVFGQIIGDLSDLRSVPADQDIRIEPCSEKEAKKYTRIPKEDKKSSVGFIAIDNPVKDPLEELENEFLESHKDGSPSPDKTDDSSQAVEPEPEQQPESKEHEEMKDNQENMPEEIEESLGDQPQDVEPEIELQEPPVEIQDEMIPEEPTGQKQENQVPAFLAGMDRNTLVIGIIAVLALLMAMGSLFSGDTAPPDQTGKINEVAENLKALTERVEGNASQLQSSKGGIDKTGQEVKSVSAQISDLQKNLDTKVKTLQNLIKANESGLTALNNQVKSLKSQSDSLKKAMDNVKNTDEIEWIVNPATKHSYTTSPAALPWHIAKAYAEKIGGHLVIINDEKENDWIVTTFGTEVEYWIGLTDELEEGKFVWVDGKQATYLNWAPKEPDNYRLNQHFVMINSIAPHLGYLEPGKWNDTYGNEPHIAIIEKDR